MHTPANSQWNGDILQKSGTSDLLGTTTVLYIRSVLTCVLPPILVGLFIILIIKAITAGFNFVRRYYTRSMHRAIKRYDLAVDIPVLRQDAFLVKDSQAYIERRHGQEWTQYLGAKSSTVGRVKLYNKQAETYLNYPLTRLEMTLDPATPYDKINFPTVFYLDDLQMCFEETKATETERFIIDALLQGCGTIDQLGRRTQAKIKALLEGYTKRVEISEQDYSRILSQVNGYKTGAFRAEVTETDQPPQRETEIPDWMQETKAAQMVQESEIIKSAAKRIPLAPHQ